MNGCRLVIQIWQARRTSGRFLLGCLQIFFVCLTKTAERTSDGRTMNGQLMLLWYFMHQIIPHGNTEASQL